MPKMTQKEIIERVKADWDIESVLDPYKEGGTAQNPVERSSGTLLDWLINKKRFPPDIAGAGLISVLVELKEGKSFQGDGSYGSKGHELAQYIAHRCNQFGQLKLKTEMFKSIAGAKVEVMDEFIFEQVRSSLPWFVRILAPGSWRWLRKRKKVKSVSA